MQCSLDKGHYRKAVGVSFRQMSHTYEQACFKGRSCANKLTRRNVALVSKCRFYGQTCLEKYRPCRQTLGKSASRCRNRRLCTHRRWNLHFWRIFITQMIENEAFLSKIPHFHRRKSCTTVNFCTQLFKFPKFG